VVIANAWHLRRGEEHAKRQRGVPESSESQKRIRETRSREVAECASRGRQGKRVQNIKTKTRLLDSQTIAKLTREGHLSLTPCDATVRGDRITKGDVSEKRVKRERRGANGRTIEGGVEKELHQWGSWQEITKFFFHFTVFGRMKKKRVKRWGVDTAEGEAGKRERGEEKNSQTRTGVRYKPKGQSFVETEEKTQSSIDHLLGRQIKNNKIGEQWSKKEKNKCAQ